MAFAILCFLDLVLFLYTPQKGSPAVLKLRLTLIVIQCNGSGTVKTRHTTYAQVIADEIEWQLA
ncbi:MAG TPA: hypothetical protein PK129_05685 [Cellvibrionaceae bacterium]|nr:hypothetical protein [Cellvibrionaceae bacterium]